MRTGIRRDGACGETERRPCCSGSLPAQGSQTWNGDHPRESDAPFTRYELHHDTATTRRVVWHSVRRMFCTDLADKDVNMQKAMDMTGHRDPRTHRRYVKLSQNRKRSLGLDPSQLSDLAKSG